MCFTNNFFVISLFKYLIYSVIFFGFIVTHCDSIPENDKPLIGYFSLNSDEPLINYKKRKFFVLSSHLRNRNINRNKCYFKLVKRKSGKVIECVSDQEEASLVVLRKEIHTHNNIYDNIYEFEKNCKYAKSLHKNIISCYLIAWFDQSSNLNTFFFIRNNINAFYFTENAAGSYLEKKKQVYYGELIVSNHMIDGQFNEKNDTLKNYDYFIPHLHFFRYKDFSLNPHEFFIDINPNKEKQFLSKKLVFYFSDRLSKDSNFFKSKLKNFFGKKVVSVKFLFELKKQK